MGAENVIITGNTTTNSNQASSGGGGGYTPPQSSTSLYARVINVNTKDRSIEYEIVSKDNFASSALNFRNKFTGIAKCHNPNFVRIPKVGELVSLIKAPTDDVGKQSNASDLEIYYTGPVSVHGTVDDNKVLQDRILLETDTNNINNYLLNEIGVNTFENKSNLPPGEIGRAHV